MHNRGLFSSPYPRDNTAGVKLKRGRGGSLASLLTIKHVALSWCKIQNLHKTTQLPGLITHTREPLISTQDDQIAIYSAKKGA